MLTLLARVDGNEFEKARHHFLSAGAAASFAVAVTVLILSLLGILFMTLVVVPNVTRRISGTIRERNLFSFAVGIPTFAIFALLLFVGKRVPPLGALAAVCLGILLIVGYAAAVEDIGRRLYSANGREGTRAAHLAAGWMVFAFGSLFPVIGWFLILPYVGLSGLGALVLTASKPRAAKSPAGESP